VKRGKNNKVEQTDKQILAQQNCKNDWGISLTMDSIGSEGGLWVKGKLRAKEGFWLLADRKYELERVRERERRRSDLRLRLKCGYRALL
jgi:hypothetical protein